MAAFFYLNHKFGTQGTELVDGGVGGGGGGPPASNLAAPKLAKINATHKHNFNFFITNPPPTVICLIFVLACLKIRTTNPLARLMPESWCFRILEASHWQSACYILFLDMSSVVLFCESVIYSDSQTQKKPSFNT
jgi:hypothetical protein